MGHEAKEDEEMTTTTVEEDEDDGPPPGFNQISTPPSREADAETHEVSDEDEEGPPPGFESIGPKPASESAVNAEVNFKQEGLDVEDEDDVDGPPPGWDLRNPSSQTPPDITGSCVEKRESDDELDEGPPPGWGVVLSNKMSPPQLQLSSSLTSSLEIKLRIAAAAADDDDKVIPSETEDVLTTPMRSPSIPTPLWEEDHLASEEKQPPPEGDEKDCEEDISHPSPQQVQQRQLDSVSPSAAAALERGQLVCGTCQKLCLYPMGTKWVQCPSCNEVNFVLEASEIGQVVCGGCSILLMYPHGAPAVQCSSCQLVTQVEEHNKRPPLSVQQAKLRYHRLKRAR